MLDCFRWRQRGGQAEGPAPYQLGVLHDLAQYKRYSARGPRGLGKTAVVAWLVLWYALTRDGQDWKIITTAGSWRQLSKFLWPEIRKWARRIDWQRVGREPFNSRTELMTLSLKLATGEAFAVASDTPDLVEGAHADQLFYVFDESKAIPAAIFDAVEGALSGAGEDTGIEAFVLAVSTPGEPVGRFYEIHARRPGFEDWHVRRVTLAECIAAGRISPKWVGDRARQWGEDSQLYKNYVEGEFAGSDEEGIIPLAWVEAAIDRWHKWAAAGKPGLLRSLGVDVAWTGGDKTVLAPAFDAPAGSIPGIPEEAGTVRAVDELRYFSKEDPMQVAGRTKGILDAHLAESAQAGLMPATALVDVIGLGAGVLTRLQEQGCRAEAFNAAERTDGTDRLGEMGFANRRAEAWWSLREALDPSYHPTLCLPDDDVLKGDLTAPHYKVASGARIQVESKDDIRERLGRSTDAGDGVVQALYTGSTPGWVLYARQQMDEVKRQQRLKQQAEQQQAQEQPATTEKERINPWLGS